jgi:hypothetical protein
MGCAFLNLFYRDYLLTAAAIPRQSRERGMTKSLQTISITFPSGRRTNKMGPTKILRDCSMEGESYDSDVSKFHT